MHTAQQIERAPRVQFPRQHIEDDDFQRRDWLAAQWQLCPNAVVLETGGDCVLIDGVGRPIIRVFADETTEILSPDAEIGGHSPVLLHYDFGLPPGWRARMKVTAYIETYKLAPEIRRRRELLRRGWLSGGWGW